MNDSSRVLEHQGEHQPHSVSLKVLRLSRPSLAYQYPLPRESTSKIPPSASLAYPTPPPGNHEFILSSNLTLPPAFGAAYVGETFSCSLCANNELTEGTTSKGLAGIRIVAEMQTPSHSLPLELYSGVSKNEQARFLPGDSLQNIIRFDLKEEGSHVLAVNVTYTETIRDEEGKQATGGKIRSFRKLYQFVAQACISVRTKATELSPRETEDNSLDSTAKSSLLRYALEAQLENVSENLVVLESAILNVRPPFKAASLNWDMAATNGTTVDNPRLNSRDVLQVCFLVEQEQDVSEGAEELTQSLKRDGRAVLGQLSIQWRGAMGEPGSLSTGNLLTRRRP